MPVTAKNRTRRNKVVWTGEHDQQFSRRISEQWSELYSVRQSFSCMKACHVGLSARHAGTGKHRPADSSWTDWVSTRGVLYGERGALTADPPGCSVPPRTVRRCDSLTTDDDWRSSVAATSRRCSVSCVMWLSRITQPNARAKLLPSFHFTQWNRNCKLNPNQQTVVRVAFKGVKWNFEH